MVPGRSAVCSRHARKRSIKGRSSLTNIIKLKTTYTSSSTCMCGLGWNAALWENGTSVLSQFPSVPVRQVRQYAEERGGRLSNSHNNFGSERASARAPFYNLFTVLLLSSSTLCWAGNFFTVRRLAGVTVAIFLRSLASYLCNVISGTRPTRFGLREVPDREPIGAVPSLSPKASAFEMSTRSSSRHCFSFSRRDTFANAAHAV